MLWRTDGTVMGSELLLSMTGKIVSSLSAGGRVFLLEERLDRYWLWSSEGTPAGTSLIGEVPRLRGGPPRIVAASTNAAVLEGDGAAPGSSAPFVATVQPGSVRRVSGEAASVEVDAAGFVAEAAVLVGQSARRLGDVALDRARRLQPLPVDRRPVPRVRAAGGAAG